MAKRRRHAPNFVDIPKPEWMEKDFPLVKDMHLGCPFAPRYKNSKKWFAHVHHYTHRMCWTHQGLSKYYRYGYPSRVFLHEYAHIMADGEGHSPRWRRALTILLDKWYPETAPHVLKTQYDDHHNFEETFESETT